MRCLQRFSLVAMVAVKLLAGSVVEPPLLEGFNDMYNLSFAAAHERFSAWEKGHPDDPRGPAFHAAAYLFSEFDRLRILQADFFTDNDSFSGAARIADPTAKRNFTEALQRSKTLADARLRAHPQDEVALFAAVTRFGLLADYEALIEKQNVRALSATKASRDLALRLLALYPDCYDAHLAEGVENYLLSQKPAPLRWLLRVSGAQTDKDAGIAKLRLTAEKGQYLRPYAQLLLAVAALRDHNRPEARRLLSVLAQRFPGNHLYRDELQKLR